MSLFDRRYLLLGGGAFALTAGCQFTPAYGPGGSAEALFGGIEIKAPVSTDDFLLTQTLEDRLGRGTVISPYQLDYGLSLESAGIGVDRDGTSQRVQVTGDVAYALRRRGEEGALAKGVVRNFTGYSNTGNTVSTAAAKRAATERLIRILADDVVERILLASQDLPL
ncbi:MAG: LPS assembly lipoprotein LptE [Marinovum sp.]|nr:LPS assembly lipoprotein LptE [Marinovum sp.]